MAKEQSRSEKPDFFAQGGSGKMFERGTAHASIPGQSGKSSNSGSDGAAPDENDAEGYGSKIRFAEGGSGKMFGKGHAGKKVPGISGKASQEG